MQTLNTDKPLHFVKAIFRPIKKLKLKGFGIAHLEGYKDKIFGDVYISFLNYD